MTLTPLTAVSPIDGRYHSKTAPLAQYMSEAALIRYRVQVEIEYFIALCDLPLPALAHLTSEQKESLRDIYRHFSLDDAKSVKDIEAVTNHDVKAVEYFIKQRFDALQLAEVKEYVHFGLTSQDINNTAVPMSLRDALAHCVAPLLEQLIDWLETHSTEWAHVAMLARTHGQPASPTRLGKEMNVYAYRLEQQLTILRSVPVSGKMGGATGNFNAHHIAFPAIDWPAFANRLLSDRLGIEREQCTTQISNYDNLAALLDALRRLATIVIDLDRDMWMYISMSYFKQRIRAGEVGSSAMPHKVNPIDFENSEGNLGLAVAMFEHLAHKLPISRLQRDLTDSTVLRNVGVPIAHLVIALNSTLKGLDKLILNEQAIAADLDNTWSVVAEAIQTVLRREGYTNPYETLKALTRTNETVDQQRIAQFIDTLHVPQAVKDELKRITPHNYTGL